MIAFRAGGRSGLRVEGSTAIFPSWRSGGRWPVAASKSTAPSEYRSLRSSTSPPEILVMPKLALHADCVNGIRVVRPARIWRCESVRRCSGRRKAHASLRLWTFQRNPAAIGFYLAQVFREIERTDRSRNEEREPDILFESVRE